ncbi:MAG TPA: hypothetical protein VIK53_03080 [Verrucomicrobiae bacterium]
MFDQKQNHLMSNLPGSMLQRMGIAELKFASSTGIVRDLETAGSSFVQRCESKADFMGLLIQPRF